MQIRQSLGRESSGLLDEVMPGNEAMPGGWLRMEDREDIKEGTPVGVPHGISDGQEDRRNRGVFLYSD